MKPFEAWRAEAIVRVTNPVEKIALQTFSAKRITRLFATWAEALVAAGSTTKPRLKRTAATPERCRDSIRQCAAELGARPGVESYGEWRNRQADPSEHPHEAAIINRYGSWDDACIDALGELK